MEPTTSKLCQAGVQQASQDEEQAGLDWPGKNRQRQKNAASIVELYKVRQNRDQLLAHRSRGRWDHLVDHCLLKRSEQDAWYQISQGSWQLIKTCPPPLGEDMVLGSVHVKLHAYTNICGEESWLDTGVS